MGFVHHQKLAIQDLTREQRADLLKKAEENGWTSARLTKERDRLLGRDERVPLLTFDDPIYLISAFRHGGLACFAGF